MGFYAGEFHDDDFKRRMADRASKKLDNLHNRVNPKLEKRENNIDDFNAKKLATILHEDHCHWNHIDGCSWYYECHGQEEDWSRYAHKDYLDKAHELMKSFPDLSVDQLKSMSKYF